MESDSVFNGPSFEGTLKRGQLKVGREGQGR
jgi:hypothetical protein